MTTIAPILVSGDEAAIIATALSSIATADADGNGNPDIMRMMNLLPLTGRFADLASELGFDSFDYLTRLENGESVTDELITNAVYVPADVPMAALGLTVQEMANLLTLASFALKYEISRGAEIDEAVVATLDELAFLLADKAGEDILTDIMDSVDAGLEGLADGFARAAGFANSEEFATKVGGIVTPEQGGFGQYL